MAAVAKLAPRMSVQEFLRWDSGDPYRYELVDGEPRAMAPAATVHAFLQSELGALIRNHLRDHRPGCRVLANPGVVPRLLSAHNFRVPDLAVTCAPLVPGQVMLNEPVLLIEILSPGNQSSTRSNVWAYTTIASAQEILVLDSVRIAAEILRRTGTGSWPNEPEQVLGGDLRLDSIGFQVPMAELYAGTGLD